MKNLQLTMCIVVLFLFACRNNKQETITYDSMDNAVVKLEAVCLASHNSNRIFSIEERNQGCKNNYEIVYLGHLKTKNAQFELLQKTILSGQEQDARRANVSLMLFKKNKLYGEYTGLNRFYSVNVKSNTLIIHNKLMHCTAKFKICDSIPAQLFLPYTCTDSVLNGDMLYLTRK